MDGDSASSARADGEELLFGRYRLIGETGRTPTGTLYAAEDVKLGGLPVTLSRLPRWLTQDERVRAALKDAVARAYGLVHPNLVTPRHLEEGEDGVYLVMDEVRGVILSDLLLREGPLGAPRVVSLLGPVAAALDAAHATGVVHGDLQPSHVLVGEDGVARLLNLGAAHEVVRASARLTGRYPEGTLGFRAPELLQGAEPTPAQDVYAWAATLYECLSGTPPFGRDATAAAVQQAVPAPLVRQPAALGRPILEGLSKDPARRPRTCAALLASAVPPIPVQRPSPAGRPARTRGEPGKARRSPPRQNPLTVLAGTWKRSRRRILIGVAILALLCLVVPVCRREGRKRPVSLLSLALSLGTSAEIDTPAEGVCLRADSVTVTGRATGSIEEVRVNDIRAQVVQGCFVADVPATEDGELTIRVTTSSGEVLDERVISIDRTSPDIVVHAPAKNPYECAFDHIAIRGEIVDRNPPPEIQVGEETVAVRDGGRFSCEIPYPKRKNLDIQIAARDAAGNESRYTIEIRRPGALTQKAVEEALKWLAAHQSRNGGWEAAGFPAWCDGGPAPAGSRPRGRGRAYYDPGVTGLALCAFLGAGYTNRGRHPFAKTVSKGLRYLKNVQDAEGCFGPRTNQRYIYSHATASLAMVEAYGMTGSPIFKGSAQKSLDFIREARNPYFAWRYGVKPGDNDTAITAWMMMALKSAMLINEDAEKHGKPPPLNVDEEAFDGIRAWIEKMTSPDTGRTGYIRRGGPPDRPRAWLDRFSADRSESTTGIGILARVFLGENPQQSRIIRKGADLCVRRPPKWNPGDGNVDMYYWHFATMAMFQVGGRHWEIWDAHLRTALLDNQRKDTTYCLYKGSWDPIGPWGPDGGRIYSTAMLATCLEVYYRYARVHESR